MYIGLSSSVGSLDNNALTASHQHSAEWTQQVASCAKLTGLVADQLSVCQHNPAAVQSVSLGARLGLMECQFQFQHDRWNCSPADVNHVNQSIFDNVVQRGTKETAFMHAVTSAGVVHAVTLACSSGNLTDCSCDMQHQQTQTHQVQSPDQAPGVPGVFGDDGWRWGGCSDNINYGVWFAMTFVDAAEREKIGAEFMMTYDRKNIGEEVRALVNLHNNEVGRKMVQLLMATKCRCHGVSGSCAVRTCWKSLPMFRRVGDALKEKYENSVEISPRVAAAVAVSTSPSSALLRRREKRMRREPIPDTDLVYVERSPNYCRPDVSRGILGTRGRECKRGSNALGPDSCHSLCCGRGYKTTQVRLIERCQCKFFWCCEVKCKTCESVFDRHTCK
jgi:wingless-type MMTV integration site family protein 16